MRSSTRHRKLVPHECEMCGEKFFGVVGHKYCSRECYLEARRKVRVVRDDGRREMRARLAARDAAYERAFPGQQGGAVRGRVAVGGRCGVFHGNTTGDFVRKFIG